MEGRIINLDKVRFIETEELTPGEMVYYGGDYFSRIYARFEDAAEVSEAATGFVWNEVIALAHTREEEQKIVASILEFLRTPGGVWDAELEVDGEGDTE
jgi:hypothetical protein